MLVPTNNKVFGVLDIETFVVLNTVEVYCLAYVWFGTTKVFDCGGGNVFKNFLNSLKNGVEYCFYVHNLTFDALVLLKHIEENCDNITWFSKNYSVYQIKFKYNNIWVEFRCFYKYLPYPLSTLAIKVLKKNKLSFPYKLLNNDFLGRGMWPPQICDFNTEVDYKKFIEQEGVGLVSIKDYLIKYCKNDAELLYDIVEKFLQSLKNKNPNILKHSYSISSYAVNYFFYKYNTFQKKITKNLELLIREAYFGGRCEVFGNANPIEYTYHFDFRGMYSLCMYEDLPTYNYRYEEVDSISTPGFYKITFTSNKDIPILPVRSDLLYFPNGQYSGTYWHEEIKLFVDEGGVVDKIHFAILCDVGPCLSKFAREFNELRSQGVIHDIVGKLVINSFYGRLGVNSVGFRDVVSNEPLDGAISYIKIHNLYINKIKTKNPGSNNVAIAAAITSKARIRLYKAFKDVWGLGGRLLYCDTDSIVAAFRDSSVLGIKMGSGLCFDPKRVDTILIKSCFAGPKTYSIVTLDGNTVTKIKGLPKNAINYNDFLSLFLSGGVVEIDMGLTIYKKNYTFGTSSLCKKIRLNNYRKRIFTKDYTDTLPLKKIPTINDDKQ